MDITMDMLDAMDAQDVFDVVGWHLLRQGVRACDEKGRCLYRGPDGTRCAVGWLILDPLYVSALEHRHVRDLAAVIALDGTYSGHRFVRFLARHMALLTALQILHDGTDPARWSENLHSLALRFGLNPKVARYQPVSMAMRHPECAVEFADFQGEAPLLNTARVFTFPRSNHGGEEREEVPVQCA